jgi:excisionase family DNA binding protein
METQNTKTKLSFEQVPEAVAHLVDEVANLKELVRLQVHHEPEKRRPISIQQASKIIGKATQTIYGLVSAKKIPYYKQGKQLYFYEDELLAYIESGKNGGGSNSKQ